MRNELGQFEKGRIETIDEKVHRMASVKEAWKGRESYTNGMRGTRFYNTWRSIRFTLKGKKAGCCDEWVNFMDFYNSMFALYTEGYVLIRNDKSKPFSKDNCKWVHRSLQRACSKQLRTVTYNGKEQTLVEWAIELDISLNGLIQRYYARGYSAEEILFGRKRQKRILNQENTMRARASKLVSSYKIKDGRRGHVCDLTKEWFIKNILTKPCTYCGGSDRIGADRISNSIGHTMENVLPCCHGCNTIRGDRFTVDQMRVLGQTIREIVNGEK